MAIVDHDVYIEALREKRKRLLGEMEATRQVVERDKATLRDSEQALQRVIARVDEIDGELREAKGG